MYSNSALTLARLYLTCAVVSAFVGCGARNPEEPTDLPAEAGPSTAASALVASDATSSPKVTKRAVVAAFDELDTRQTGDRAEVDGADWDSERVSQLASATLGLFETVILQGADVPELARATDEALTVGLLRPQKLTEVFKDKAFSVYRGSTASESKPAVGRNALRKQLQQLGGPLQSAATKRFEHKVTRVEVDGDTVTTKSLVHLVGETATEVVQLNVTWRCKWKLGQHGDPQLRGIDSTDYEEVHARPSQFVDCTRSVLHTAGVCTEVLSHGTDHWLDRVESKYGLDPAAWNGLAVGDVNNDGLEDLYVCQPGGIPNVLLLQASDGTVEDHATQAGVDFYDQTQSALLVDLDNDGDQDLVAAISMGLTIMENDGAGRFTLRAAKLMPEGIPYSLSAADYDNDGRLDLYACCYSKRTSELSHRFLGRPVPYHDANNGARNALFRNLGSWQFRDVTRAVGLGENNSRFSFAASWEDYDNDGDLDVYVANDYGRNNLYRNNAGRFSDVAASVGVEDMSAGMSASWGDVDNDGWMDIYVSNMFSSAGNRVTYQRQFKQGIDAETLAGFQRHARGNSLFVNQGNDHFKDVSTAAGVTMGRWAWGSTLVDINNDGFRDIVVANGFLTQHNPDDL